MCAVQGRNNSAPLNSLPRLLLALRSTLHCQWVASFSDAKTVSVVQAEVLEKVKKQAKRRAIVSYFLFSEAAM